MRKLPFIASTIATTLLCSSLALAQEEDYSDYGYDAASSESSYDESTSSESESEPAPSVQDGQDEYSSESSLETVNQESSPSEAPSLDEENSQQVASQDSNSEEQAPVKDLTSTAPVAVPAPVKDAPATLSAVDQLDTIEANIDNIAENMESTLMGKDDAPIAVSGFMAFRVKNFHYTEASDMLASDQARTSVDAIFKANIVAMPNSYMTLWTNITMPFDLSGLYTNSLGSQPTNVPTNDERVLYDHSTDYYSTTIDEEINLGVDIRAGIFGAYVTAGGVIWANSSPLTLWERETNPRFAWQYELFEDEKTVSTYYKEKVFKPVKEGGRAFWTNRSFGGVFMNVYQLPWDLTAQAMVSQPADMDIGTRDGLRMYGGQPGELEMSGDYDFRGAVYHGRLAKNKIADNLSLGLNYVGVVFDNALVYEQEFYSQYNKYDLDPTITDVHVASVDFKGNITPKLYLLADVAVSILQNQEYYQADGVANSTKYEKDSYETSTEANVGVYVKAQSKYIEGWPMTLEAIYLPKDFYSPYSMSNPSRFLSWRKDEFALNAGSLRYTPNIVGVNLKVEPEFARGHLDLQYGIHSQVEEGDDVLVFNYRLNGRTVWESTNSWTKHKPLFWADSGNGRANGYVERAGVLTPGTGLKLNRQQGGLRGGTWELWETFVAYENAQQIQDSTVPTHTKWSTYLSVAGGYDIGHWFGTNRNIVMSGYASISGVSTTIAPIPYSESQTDMLLWSFYGQFEPAIAVTPTFHVVGILGLETFRSEYGYTINYVTNSVSKTSPTYSDVSSSVYSKAPINILETAIGIGFDWDFADRAGLHFRYKWATHTDEVLSANDWKGHFITAETKVWF